MPGPSVAELARLKELEKSARVVQEALADRPAVTRAALAAGVPHIQRAHYIDLVEERATRNFCGWVNILSNSHANMYTDSLPSPPPPHFLFPYSTYKRAVILLLFDCDFMAILQLRLIELYYHGTHTRIVAIAVLSSSRLFVLKRLLLLFLSTDTHYAVTGSMKTKFCGALAMLSIASVDKCLMCLSFDLFVHELAVPHQCTFGIRYLNCHSEFGQSQHFGRHTLHFSRMRSVENYAMNQLKKAETRLKTRKW